MRKFDRRDFLAAGLSAASYAWLARALPAAYAADGRGRYNVLFIAVDDLRPQVGCYGFPVVKTPNIDALARRGMLFSRAYCQEAVCSPSRTSLLTGRRPDTTKVHDLQTHFRLTIPDVVALPEHFKRHGYHTEGLSKIYHGGLDDPQSWSVPHWNPRAPAFGKPETLEAVRKETDRLRAEGRNLEREALQKDPKTGLPLVVRQPIYRVNGPCWEDPDVPDNALADGMTADRAVESLRQLRDKRFFLAVGFHKPHLPFVAPKRYFDLYSCEEIALARNPFPPKDTPQIALENGCEPRGYWGVPKTGPISEETQRELIRAYLAATSYVDAQVGRLLNELDRLGLRDNTVVALWGDHGWHLGEHGLWGKRTNFEEATRSPLIISAPDQKSPGAKTDALSEFVDVYPTLCDLCGLPLPDGLEGLSLAPVMREPARAWKKAAFSQFPRGKTMGYTMRTDRYRYTEWVEPGKEPVAVELYDHRKDPEENTNVAGLPGNKDLVARLAKMLHDGWRAARP